LSYLVISYIIINYKVNHFSEVNDLDLTTASEENLAYLLDKIGDKLDVANRIIVDPKDYDLNQYDDLKFFYDHIKESNSFSPAEVQAYVDELKTLRKA